MRYFPIFFDLNHKTVLVVGGGEEACRKIRLLLKTDARIALVAPALPRELKSESRVEWLSKNFDVSQLNGVSLVYSAEPAVNEFVSAQARQRGIPINVIDVAEISTFLTPSIVNRDPVVVAIGTEGTAPVLGQGIRARIDAMLPQALGDLARRAQALRPHVAQELPPGNRRRSFWSKYFFGAIRDAFVAGDGIGFAQELAMALKDDAAPAVGRISIVGVGPGDPELLTIKAQRKLQEADHIVFENSVPGSVLELARRDAERVSVSATQFDVVAVLMQNAQAGRHVVFLTPGDGDARHEEFSVLRAKGFAVEFVPGIAAEHSTTDALPQLGVSETQLARVTS